MANSHHIPGLIRGHEGTIIMVDHGQFERPTEFITVIPELQRHYTKGEKPTVTAMGGDKYKFGTEPIKIPVDNSVDMMNAHIDNFIKCMHTREKPHLDVETGARAQSVINLAVASYREGKVKFWDDKNWKASDKPAKA